MGMLEERSAIMHDLQDMWLHMHSGLRAFIARRVANEAEADDILQEVFLRMHKRLDSLKDPGRLVSWAFQITRRAIADYYRTPERRREKPAGSAADMDTANLLPTGDRTHPLADFSDPREELAACLRPMIQRLSLQYKEALTLVELEGLTQNAAANRLGLSLSGMKSRVQRGRQQLKQLLEECCVIHLDRRHAITDYILRDSECKLCGLSDNHSLSQPPYRRAM